MGVLVFCEIEDGWGRRKRRGRVRGGNNNNERCMGLRSKVDCGGVWTGERDRGREEGSPQEHVED